MDFSCLFVRYRVENSYVGDGKHPGLSGILVSAYGSGKYLLTFLVILGTEKICYTGCVKERRRSQCV